jgi:osmotically inducible protein OsmC
MREIIRKAGAVWEGDLPNGHGEISTESRVLYEQPYSYRMRFENEPGTNPEELIAAAHAACFCMALAATLKQKGFTPVKLEANTSCYLMSKEEGGFAITSMQLHIRAVVPDIDGTRFEQICREADQGCPVSNLLRSGLEIQLSAELVKSFAPAN